MHNPPLIHLPTQFINSIEYELPSDFEDEEIDEDEAFNEEDNKLYAHIFGDGEGGSSGGDFSDGSSEDVSGSDGDLLKSDSEGEGEEVADEFESEEEEEEEEGDSDLDAENDVAGEGSDDEDLLSGISDADDEDDLDEAGAAASEDEEAEEERHAAMLQAVTGGAGRAGRKRKRERDVVTEVYPESEYNLPAHGECAHLGG
jgi:U3 small nucleolar RNA-associated protein 14